MNVRAKRLLPLAIAGLLIIEGCALSKMVKMAKDQKLTVTPSPLEVHGDSVAYDMSAVLPVKMLKKNKIYTMGSRYAYANDQSVKMPDVEFKWTDFQNAKTVAPQQTKHFSFFYKPEIGNGNLKVMGTAYNADKTKSKSTPEMDVAPGLITTSRLVNNVHAIAYAFHGYNDKEELVPTFVDFFFEQGKSKLRKSEMSGVNGKFLDAFIAKKNVTRTVSIVGTHSPEGSESKNSALADERSKVIEKYTKERMKFFKYESTIDSIRFVTKGVILDWDPLRKVLDTSSVLTADEKSQVYNIINGSGSFESKQDMLSKLSFYKKMFTKIYPKLRNARTEILTVKPKKSKAEIANLAKLMASGSVKMDTLSDEELAYAATLTPILSEKESIYKTANSKSDSWVSHNNLGAVYIEMAKREVDDNAKRKLLDDAVNQLNISIARKDNAEAHLNLATAYLLKGMRAESYKECDKAMNMQPSDDIRKGAYGVMGVLNIKDGKYDNAVQNLSKSTDSVEVMYDLALANLLKKDFNAAKAGFASVTSKAPNHAWAWYLSAVTAARLNDEGGVTSNLKKAVSINKTLVDRALSDYEFDDYWNSDNFKNALK